MASAPSCPARRPTARRCTSPKGSCSRRRLRLRIEATTAATATIPTAITTRCTTITGPERSQGRPTERTRPTAPARRTGTDSMYEDGAYSGSRPYLQASASRSRRPPLLPRAAPPSDPGLREPGRGPPAPAPSGRAGAAGTAGDAVEAEGGHGAVVEIKPTTLDSSTNVRPASGRTSAVINNLNSSLARSRRIE